MSIPPTPVKRDRTVRLELCDILLLSSQVTHPEIIFLNVVYQLSSLLGLSLYSFVDIAKSNINMTF